MVPLVAWVELFHVSFDGSNSAAEESAAVAAAELDQNLPW